MRRLKKMGVVITALLALAALGATMAASASAALPEFEPGGKAGEKFTSTSGAGTLEEGGQPAITCTADTDTGEFIGTSKKEILSTIDFTTCSVFGIVGAHSLGDKEGTILVHVTGVLCYLNKTKKEVGVTLALPSAGIHIEVAGKLLLVTGTAIGLVKPVNTRSKTGEIILKQSKGVQEFTKCEGGSEETLKTAENEGTAAQSGEQTTDTETFEKEVEVLA
jgi:hypothetical protein